MVVFLFKTLRRFLELSTLLSEESIAITLNLESNIGELS
jgi:hypothetical protein